MIDPLGAWMSTETRVESGDDGLAAPIRGFATRSLATMAVIAALGTLVGMVAAWAGTEYVGVEPPQEVQFDAPILETNAFDGLRVSAP
jgi:hypothetical protein